VGWRWGRWREPGSVKMPINEMDWDANDYLCVLKNRKENNRVRVVSLEIGFLNIDESAEFDAPKAK
jgi:hypothetical protein